MRDPAGNGTGLSERKPSSERTRRKPAAAETLMDVPPTRGGCSFRFRYVASSVNYKMARPTTSPDANLVCSPSSDIWKPECFGAYEVAAVKLLEFCQWKLSLFVETIICTQHVSSCKELLSFESEGTTWALTHKLK